MHTAKSTGTSRKKSPNYTEHHETEGNYRTNVIGGGRTKLTAFGMPGRCYATAGTKTHGANYGWWASSLSLCLSLHSTLNLEFNFNFLLLSHLLTGHVLASTNHLGSSSQQALLLFIHS